MKTTIYYFTGTGNCLKVAEDLAAAIGDAEIVSIPKAIRKPEPHWNEADNIGFVFPVYFEGPPVLVNRFVQDLHFSDKKYIFAVATCGETFGDTMSILNKHLPENQSLSLGEIIKMPGNYLAWYGAWSEKRQQQAFERQKEKVLSIASAVKAQETKPLARDNFLFNGFTKFWYPKFEKEAKIWDRGFSVDATCNHCQICMRVCPVDNITFEEGLPRWNGHCEQCFACIQWCPQKAIQCGKGTRKRRRYHHPEVKASDLFMS